MRGRSGGAALLGAMILPSLALFAAGAGAQVMRPRDHGADAGVLDGGSHDAGPTHDSREAPPDADGAAPHLLTAVAGHVMVEGSPNAVRVTEVFVLNISAGTAGPPSADTPWIPLPEGADRVTIERGEELLRPIAGGLGLADAPAPGRHPLAFSFIVPAEDGRAVISHELPFAVEGLHVMWAAGAAFSARAMGFEDRGVVEMGPRRMRILERPGFQAGDRLVIVTSAEQMSPAGPAPRRPEASDPLGQLRTLTMVLSLLLLLAGALLPFGAMVGREKT